LRRLDWVKVNKYGRDLGKVLLTGLDCNLVQVKRGLAWPYKPIDGSLPTQI
jgi:endonuclease YncB( thermonuclease family)